MRTKLGKLNPKNFLRNAEQEFPCQSLASFSGEYYNMEKKSLTFSLDLCAPNKLAQVTVLEATKMEHQKSSMTDGVHENGTTEECECAVMKFQQLRHSFKIYSSKTPLEYSCSRIFCCEI